MRLSSKPVLALSLALAGCGGGSGDDGGSVKYETAPLPSLAVRANDLVAANGRLYLAVASDDPDRANVFATVDPATKTFVSTVSAGEDPRSVAIAEDGRTALVSYRSTGEVKRIDLASSAVSPAFTVPSAFDIPRYALDLAFVPGSPDQVAVVVGEQEYERPVAVYVSKNGAFLPEYTRTNSAPTDVAFGNDPTRLYGYDGSIGGYSSLATLSDTGARLTRGNPLSNGYGSSAQVYAGGLVLPNGVVQSLVDLEPIGRFETGIGPSTFAAHLVSESRNRAYFLSGDVLRVYDLASKRLLRHISLRVGAGSGARLETGYRLAPYGERGVAIIDQAGHLAFLEDAG